MLYFLLPPARLLLQRPDGSSLSWRSAGARKRDKKKPGGGMGEIKEPGPRPESPWDMWQELPDVKTDTCVHRSPLWDALYGMQ